MYPRDCEDGQFPRVRELQRLTHELWGFYYNTIFFERKVKKYMESNRYKKIHTQNITQRGKNWHATKFLR